MYLQEGHFQTILKLLGASPATSIPGYVNFPPSKLQRLQQELGGFRAVYLLLRRNLAFCIVGANLSYFRGDVRIEQQYTLRSLLCAIFRRKTIIPLANNQTVRSPLSLISDGLTLSEDAETHAKVGYNTAIVIFALHENKSIVLHCPTSDDGHRLVKRHRTGIRNVSSTLSGTRFEDMVPKPIVVGCNDLVSTQSVVTGVAPDLCSIDSAAYNNFLNQSLDWILDLHKLVHQPEIAPALPSLSKLKGMLTESDWGVVNRLSIAVSNWCLNKRLGSVLQHGDYWLGNVLFNIDTHQITGVVDWEWCEVAGLPGLDALQLVLMSRSRRSKQALPIILYEWFESGNLDPLDNYLLRKISYAYGYNDIDCRYIGIYLWLDTLRRGYLETQPENDSWLKEFLTLPGPCFLKWHESQANV